MQICVFTDANLLVSQVSYQASSVGRRQVIPEGTGSSWGEVRREEAHRTLLHLQTDCSREGEEQRNWKKWIHSKNDVSWKKKRREGNTFRKKRDKVIHNNYNEAWKESKQGRKLEKKTSRREGNMKGTREGRKEGSRSHLSSMTRSASPDSLANPDPPSVRISCTFSLLSW